MVTAIEVNVVTAATAGDPAALERLVADYLPLLYNAVGRALPATANVDDTVRETMLHVVHGLPTLRDTNAFRSWLVTVAMHQVRNRTDATAPGTDFTDLTLTELGLTGQRREVAMAASWLDPDDRELLSLWWLAEAGHLTRGEVVTATGLDPHHVTVRVARMKAQLDASRTVVRALCTTPTCPELAGLAVHWPRRPEPLWRKRFARHIRECFACVALTTDFVPAERLLAGLPLLPVPSALTDAVYRQIAAALQAGALQPMAPSFQPTEVYEQAVASYQPIHEQAVPSYGHQLPAGSGEPVDPFVSSYGHQPPAGSGELTDPFTSSYGHQRPVSSAELTDPFMSSYGHQPPLGSGEPADRLVSSYGHRPPTGPAEPTNTFDSFDSFGSFDPFDPFGSTDQPPTVPIASVPGRPPGPHSHRRIPQAGARTAASHLAAKAAVALAATAAVVGAAVVAANLDNANPEPQASGAPDAVLSSTSDTPADPSATVTSSPVASSATTPSESTTPSTSHRSSAKPAPSTFQSLTKAPTSSAGNSAAASSAGKPPVPSSSATTSTTPPAPSSSSSPSPSSPGEVSPEDQVLALINQARADQGLPPLTRTAGLDKSAAGHTSVMASTCGLSHQCPGEPGLGARETAAGVTWTSAGENIGDGGPVADSNDAIASMALGLTKSMLAEHAPDDGHRRNILSTGFHHIGISVYRDNNGTVWMTQDFSD
ncbi:MAG: CAP domain-containing protein [Catenulispora sp.]